MFFGGRPVAVACAAGHTLHEACLRSWLDSRRRARAVASCPLCRGLITWPPARRALLEAAAAAGDCEALQSLLPLERGPRPRVVELAVQSNNLDALVVVARAYFGDPHPVLSRAWVVAAVRGLGAAIHMGLVPQTALLLTAGRVVSEHFEGVVPDVRDLLAAGDGEGAAAALVAFGLDALAMDAAASVLHVRNPRVLERLLRAHFNSNDVMTVLAVSAGQGFREAPVATKQAIDLALCLALAKRDVPAINWCIAKGGNPYAMRGAAFKWGGVYGFGFARGNDIPILPALEPRPDPSEDRVSLLTTGPFSLLANSLAVLHPPGSACVLGEDTQRPSLMCSDCTRWLRRFHCVRGGY